MPRSVHWQSTIRGIKAGEHILVEAITHAFLTMTGSMPPIYPVPGKVSLHGLANPIRVTGTLILIHQSQDIRQDQEHSIPTHIIGLATMSLSSVTTILSMPTSPLTRTTE